MYCTYWYTVWPHCQVGSTKRTKIDVLISGMALCHTVFQQLSATALVRGHLQVWVSLPLCAWKATKKNNSLLWIHLTAVLTPGGKFSRLCSQEDAVRALTGMREHRRCRAAHGSVRTCRNKPLLWPRLTPFPRPAIRGSFASWTALLLLAERGGCRKSVWAKIHVSTECSCSLLPHTFKARC